MAGRKSLLTLQNLVSVRGRIDRAGFAVAFWSSLVILFVVFFALSLLPDMVSDDLMDAVEGPLLWAVIVFMVFIYFVLFCVLGQRLHDVGLSAWYGLILFSGVTLTGLMPSLIDYLVLHGMIEVHEPLALAIQAAIQFGRLGYGLALILGLTLSLWPGQKGDNRYGADLRAQDIRTEMAEG